MTVGPTGGAPGAGAGLDSLAAALAAATASGPSTTSTWTDQPVWWGSAPGKPSTHAIPTGDDGRGKRVITSQGADTQITPTANAALSWLQQQLVGNTPQWQAVYNEMIDAGQISKGASPFEALSKWSDIVRLAATTPGAIQQKLGPKEILSMWAAQGRATIAAGSAPTTAYSTNLSSASQVESAYVPAFNSIVGRDPSAGEVGQAVAAVNAGQRANPSKTVSSNKGGVQTSVSSGGYDPTQALKDMAESNPETGAYQAAAYYYPILQQLFGPTTPAGNSGR